VSLFSIFGPPHSGPEQATYRRDTWPAHTRAVGILQDAGIAPPPEWSAVHQRYIKLIELPDEGLDRLANAVINGTGDWTELRALAMTEELARSAHDANINEQVQQRVLTELVNLYKAAAPRNYKLAAAKFDTAAAALTAAAKHIDLESPGDQLAAASSAARQAWLDAPSLATELGEALHALCAAAALAGAPPDVAFVTSSADDITTAEHQIGLCADPGKAHRRKVWEAWAITGGRTARWGALHKLGVKLRAASDPVTAFYKRPENLVTVQKPGGRLGQWDPHDGDLPRGWFPVNVGWIAEKPSTTGIL
jgi:hypothetical protein